MNKIAAVLDKYPYLFPVIATFLWGTNYVFGKIAVASFPPVHLSLMRWLIAAIVLFPFFYKEIKTHWPLFMQHWKLTASISLTGVAGFNTLLYYGLLHTTSINASIINSFQPVIIVILSTLILKESMHKGQAFGFIISFVGFLILFSHGEIARLLSFTFNPGDLIVFIAMFIWAVYSVMLKIAGPILPKNALFTLTVGMAVITLLPALVIESILLPVPWHLFTVDYALLVLYIAVLPTVVAFLCWNESINRLGVGKSSNFLHLVPMFTAAFAVLFGEVLNLYHIVGGALIIFGIVLSTNPAFLRLLRKFSSRPEAD